MTTEQRAKNLKLRAKELLESVPIDAIGKCSRRAMECTLSCLSLLNDEALNNDRVPLRLDKIEKMKKHVKGKRCVLDQDASAVTNLVSMLEEDDEHDFIKKEKVFVIDLEVNIKIEERRAVSKIFEY